MSNQRLQTAEEMMTAMRDMLLRTIIRTNIGAQHEFTNDEIRLAFVAPSDAQIEEVRAFFRAALVEQERGKN